jgi:hypothetical protein
MPALGVPAMFPSAIALNNRGDIIASQDEMEPAANAVVYCAEPSPSHLC